MLESKFCGLTFANPLVLPSGIFTQSSQYLAAVKAGAAAITAKSLTVEPRLGYAKPWIIKFEHGYLNAVGLANSGLVKGKKEMKKLLSSLKVPLIVSLFATTLKDFEKLVSEMTLLKPAGIELNLSCPHVTSEFGKPLAMEAKTVAKVVKLAKRASLKVPIIAKLTPNIFDTGQVARAAEMAGADAICAINTVGPGMVIDIKTRKPLLGNKRGGLSGPAIKPIAIRCIYDIYEAVKIPIIGMGGISSWQDTVEMMMAGATLVGVGSAIYFKGLKVFKEINNGLEGFLRKEKIKNISQLIGVAHHEAI